jgi:hypothetical protein
LIIILIINTGTLALTLAQVFHYDLSVHLMTRVAIEGYRIPPPEMANLARYRELNIGRVAFFKAWGVFSLLGDVAVCGTSRLIKKQSHAGGEIDE